MGGCQSASDAVINEPRKHSFSKENKFNKLTKHQFQYLPPANEKLKLATTTGKITDYITINESRPVKDTYSNLDIAKNLDGNKKFLDPDFGNKSQNISQKPMGELIEWKRPSQFMKGQYSVFQGRIQPNDIQQGKLGDCYLLSAITAISEYPFIVKRIFSTTEQSSYGAYGVWLFIDGFWQCIIVDDRFPITNGKPIFSRNNENQLWVMLIEKAYAKVFGSYQIIESGLTGVALNALTGAPFEYVCKDSQNRIDVEEAWQFVKTHTAMNHLLTGSTENNDRNAHLGLVSTHAYTILDCQEVHISTKKGKKKQKILKISNPWGRYEWRGRWSDSSEVWSPQLKEQLDFKQENDGAFWINISDFVENFGQICACKFNKNYVNTSIPLHFSMAENDFKCSFLSVVNRTQGYINVYQKDYRFFPNTTYKYSMVRLIVLKIDKGTKTLSRYVNDVLDCDRDTSIYVELDPGDYYVVVQMDWKGNFSRQVTLNFYGQHPVALHQDPNPPAIQQLFNEIVLLHESYTELERIYLYEKDPHIKRVTGSLAGYVYYHYSNRSKSNNYLCQSVILKEKKYIQVDDGENEDEFLAKVYPNEQKILRLKVQKEGNSYYSFSTKIQFYIVEKYSLEKLRDLADKKPSKLRKREIQSKQIDVFVKTYNYTGGVAILYQNKMDKYAYVEELTLELDNLDLENGEVLPGNKIQVQLEPQTQKLLSFVVRSPGKEVVFRTKVSFYLNSPQLKF